MSSNLNLNISSNNANQLPQDTSATGTATKADAAVKTGTTAQAAPKDTVDRSEQPAGSPINLSAYIANTSRPVLPKPSENTPKKQDAVNRDFEGEHAAGTLAAGENVPTEQTTAEEPLQAQEQPKKQQQDGDQGSQGGSSGQGDSKDTFVNKSIDDVMKELNTLVETGKVTPMEPDDISALLNNFGNPTGAVGKVGDLSNVELPKLTIEGNTITGPNGSYTIPPPQSPPKSPSDMLTNTYNQVKAMADMATEMMKSMPEGPEKITLANFLKTLMKALTDFQEFLYVMNNISSKEIREKSKAQLETNLHKLEEQRKKQEEEARKAREAGEKGGIMGILGKVFGAVGISMSFVLVVVAIAMACTGIGAGFAIATLTVTVTFLVVSIASMITTQATGKGIFERAFEGIGKLVSAFLNAIGIDGAANEWITLVAKIILVVLVCVMVIASNPLIFLFGGVSNVVGFITDSGIINGFVEKCGGDEKAQMITSIVVTATIMMATMVISIAMMFIPGAQGALLGQIGSITANVTKTVVNVLTTVLQTVLRVSEKVAETTTKVIMAMLKFILNPGFWMTVSMLGLQTVDTVNKVKMNYLLADLAMLQGEMTKMIEAADALIAIFKKVIQKLLESLTETGTFISQTSDLIKKMVQGQSESISNLWSA